MSTEFTNDGIRHGMPHSKQMVWMLAATLVLLAGGALAAVSPGIFSAALFSLGPATPPTVGLYVSTGYDAVPNERGSVVLESGQAFTGFEGLSLTFVVDSARASIVRVRRTAITDDFKVSYDFPGPGVVHVSLVGDPVAISAGGDLLEFELQLSNSSINTTGNTIDLRLLGTKYVSTAGIGSTATDGLITFVSSTDSLSLPFTPHISDVDPGALAIVRAQPLTIRGKSLPANPRVLLGNRPIPVTSASPTEILAMVPEDALEGEYEVSVDSLLAEETVVVITAPGITSPVEILDELMFVNPNPVLYPDAGADIVLWIPIFNPLGSAESIIGSVDFSALGGDPNVVFSGTGEPAVGPGGEMVNWFRVPQSGAFSIAAGHQTNSDYPVTVRVENGAVTNDEAVELVRLRSQIPLGDAPSFGSFDTVPTAPPAGQEVSFFVDVTHPEGVEEIDIVSIRLTPVGGGIEELSPVLSGVPLTTVAYTADFTIPATVPPAAYFLELVAADKDGDTASISVPFVVSPPGGAPTGSPPIFGSRIEARPATTGPGAEVDFFVEVADPDGTSTIKTVTIDLIDVGGSTKKLNPTEDLDIVSTLPVVFETSFTLPSTISGAVYLLPVRAIDMRGLSATTTIALTVDPMLGGGGSGGSPPVFAGRLEAVPSTIPLEGKAKFFVGVSDPEGTETIEKVTIDLVDVGGGILEMKETVGAVAGAVVPEIYAGEFSLPNTVVPGFYSLAVRAVDEDGNAATTSLILTVSAVASPSGAPVILQSFASPGSVPADAQTEVFFTVEVEDGDGMGDITIARINLSPINLPITPLKLDTTTTTKMSDRGFFLSSKIKVPRTVVTGSYNLLVEIEDAQGGSDSQSLQLDVGGSFGGDVPKFLDVRFVPEVGSPGGKLRLFAEMEDQNSADGEDLTVVADFTEIRLDAVELDEIISFPSGTLVTRNTFASKTLTLPNDLPVGVYDVPLTAIDDTNNVVRAVARIRIERGGGTLGAPPKVDVLRAFQTPPVFPNDGSDDGELHILVSDPDDDVVAVIANFGALGKATSASISGTNDLQLFCNKSRAIVCLEKSVPESRGSRWFVLKGIAIPPTTAASSEPYFIELTTIDADGHTDQARVSVLIGEPGDLPQIGVPPAFELIVPVSDRALELVAAPPVNTASVERGGAQFQMKPVLDASEILGVNRVSFDTSARILYLETDPMIPGETYIFSTVTNSAETPALTDIYGNRFGGTVRFTAYDGIANAPSIESVKVADPEHIEVTFGTQVLPSSVHTDILPMKASIVSTVTGDRKAVHGGQLQKDGRTLLLSTDRLREGDRYRLRLEEVIAPGLIRSETALETIFISVFPRGEVQAEGPLLLPTADLNRDGRVDFADFALFSSVYDTEYNFNTAGDLLPAAPPQQGEGKADGSNLGGPLPNLQF